jgi:hypothetical protein
MAKGDDQGHDPAGDARQIASRRCGAVTIVQASSNT